MPPAQRRENLEDAIVSIVVDNYNYARFLRRSIDSALAQTHPRVQVVVVDDGSTDASVDIIKSYGDQVNFVGKPNGGQASAVNAGIAVSNGDIVIVLDSDDELYPEAAERVAARMTPAAAKAHWRLEVVDGEGNSLGYTEPVAEVALAHGDVVPQLLHRGSCATPVMSGNAFPRWVLDRLLPIPEGQYYTSADEYLRGMSGLFGPVVAIDEVLGLYRIHGTNASKPTVLNVKRLARYVEVDQLRNASIARTAIAMGHLRLPSDSPLPDFALNDQFGLRARVTSLRLDPDHHPVPGDRLAGLAWHGAQNALFQAPLDVRRRVLFCLWFVIVAFAPYPVAHRAAEWLHVKGSRPTWMQWLMPRRRPSFRSRDRS